MKALRSLSRILAVAALVLGCSEGDHPPIENPVSADSSLSQTVGAASSAKSKICHFDSSGSSVIVVGDTSLPVHFAHGDCLSTAPKGSKDCGCFPPPVITWFERFGDCGNPVLEFALVWRASNATSGTLELRRGGALIASRSLSESIVIPNTVGSQCNAGFPCFSAVPLCNDTLTFIANGPGGTVSSTIPNV